MAVVSSRSLRRVPSAWNGQQMKAVKPAVWSCSARSCSRWFTMWRGVSPKPNTMVAVVRRPSACPWRMTSSQVSVVHLSGEIWWRISSSRISAPPPGIESRPGGDQPLDDRADRHVLELGDVADLLGRQAVDREREVGLHPAEQILVPGERQVGVEPALQQDLHAAQVDGLLELLRQHLARQRVALLAGGRAVEVAELAAGDADVGVVDVAVDDVGDDAVGVQRVPAGVGGGAQVQHRRLGVEAHAARGAVWQGGGAATGTGLLERRTGVCRLNTRLSMRSKNAARPDSSSAPSR